MKLEEITNGASLEGVEPSIVVTVVAAFTIPPDSLQLIYRLPDGALRERLLSRANEASLIVATIRGRGRSTATAPRSSSPPRPSASISRTSSIR